MRGKGGDMRGVGRELKACKQLIGTRVSVCVVGGGDGEGGRKGCRRGGGGTG